MSTKLQALQETAAKAAKTAREIAEKAGLEGRSLTDTEQHDYDESMAKGRDFLAQIKVAKADEEVLNQAKALADEIGPLAVADLHAQAEVGGIAIPSKSLGRMLVESEQFKAALAPFGGRISEKQRFSTDPIRVKSLFTGGSSTSAGAFVINEDSGILEPLGRRTLTLRDLISVRTTGSDAVEYVRQTSHTNNAAPVAEATSSAAPTAPGTAGALVLDASGGYKPEGAWAYVRITANVRTIAEWVPATKRALSDAGQLAGLIDAELRADIAEAEEGQILNGDGLGENLPGILTTSGIQTQAFVTDIFTSVRKGLTKARVGGRVNPNGILMNPTDAETVDLAREGAGTGAFLGGGPFGQMQRTMWGVPIVESEAQPVGFATVADFSKAVLWDREETTISITDSHADFFIRNLVAVLGEERVAFGLTRPSAVVNVDIAA